jgi:hypothetical protein
MHPIRLMEKADQPQRAGALHPVASRVKGITKISFAFPGLCL